MKNTFCLLALASLLFVSCKKTELTDDVVTEAAPEKSIESVMPPQSIPTGTNSVMNTSTNYSTTTATPAGQTPIATAAGMNPKHGQPGHRCEIAEGAPLNSASKPAAAPQQTKPVTISSATTTPGTVTTNGATITTVNNSAPATTPVVTAPGMNPPHGQEGHVCSVAVGAPLPK